MYSILRMTLIHAMTIASKIKKREEKILGVTKKKTFFSIIHNNKKKFEITL